MYACNPNSWTAECHARTPALISATMDQVSGAISPISSDEAQLKQPSAPLYISRSTPLNRKLKKDTYDDYYRIKTYSRRTTSARETSCRRFYKNSAKLYLRIKRLRIVKTRITIIRLQIFESVTANLCEFTRPVNNQK